MALLLQVINNTVDYNRGNMPAKNPKKYAKKHYEKNKEYYRQKCQEGRRRNKLWLEDFKKQHKCERCSESDYRCLVFHHRDPNDKEFEIWKAACHNYSIERIQKEIEKCEILCANCHMIEHYNEMCKT